MKIVYVIDSITDLKHKIYLLTNRFGDNIFYVVRADLVELFKTYDLTPHAIYYKNLTEIIHKMLMSAEIMDTIICYASLSFNDNLLTKFTNSIGNKTKVVSLMPKYSGFEKVCNSAYNVYVKAMFKTKDSLISPKLQFIPAELVNELLLTHLGNRLFEIDDDLSKSITVEDDEINKSMKTKSPALKFSLIACIIALVLTLGLLASIAYFKVNYLIILIFFILYVLDFMLSAIFFFKNKFDYRFLK